MLSQEEYHELLLKEGPESDKSRAEYIRQKHGGGWHLSDEEVLRQVHLNEEKLMNHLSQYESISWYDWMDAFRDKHDELSRALGLTPPIRKKYVKINDELVGKFFDEGYTVDEVIEKINEIERENGDYVEDDDENSCIYDPESNEYFDNSDNLGWLRKARYDIAMECEKMGELKHGEISSIKFQIFQYFMLMSNEMKAKLPCVKFI